MLWVALLASLWLSPRTLKPRLEALPPKTKVVILGNATSNLPHIYRDGGGGGKVNGLNLIMFSDGIYTSGGEPAGDNSNFVNFTSNSIACSNCDGNGPHSFLDYGTLEMGPVQQVPFFYGQGEDDAATGIWPNQGFATLCEGACAVSFPQVVNRSALPAAANANPMMYNTAVQITLAGNRPVVSRPKRVHFKYPEPFYGTFGALAGTDGYLYLFAQASQLAAGNGLKMVRVVQESWNDRSEYQYWDGTAWGKQMPRLDDGGRANFFNYSQLAFGVNYGPGTGEIFLSSYYGAYVLIFQPDCPALDQGVYLSYSTGDLSGPWTKPTRIFTVTTLSTGYPYSFHVYPDYDPSGKVIPMSWTEFGQPSTFLIAMANLTFS